MEKERENSYKIAADVASVICQLDNLDIKPWLRHSLIYSICKDLADSAFVEGKNYSAMNSININDVLE